MKGKWRRYVLAAESDTDTFWQQTPWEHQNTSESVVEISVMYHKRLRSTHDYSFISISRRQALHNSKTRIIESMATFSSRYGTVRSSYGHVQIKLRSRSDQGTVTVRSRYGHVHIKVRSSSFQVTVTVRSRYGHGQIKVRSRSDQGTVKVFSSYGHGQIKVWSRQDQGMVTVLSRYDHDQIKVG